MQTLLGKRGSFPYGLLAGFTLFEITALVIASDFAQTFILLNFFDLFASKLHFIKRRKIQAPGWREKIKKWGAPGIVAISALPYGGGALTGSILAISFNVKKGKAFWSIAMGCVIGSLLFYIGFGGILTIFPLK